jgi:hypothetical protein
MKAGLMSNPKWPLAGLVAVAVLSAPTAALARPGWDCTFQGTGSAPARYIAHLEIHGRELVEPHWPAATAYRIMVDTREFLIATRATVVPPAYRRDARGVATVLMIDKLNGRMRRSTGESGEGDDRIETGLCERRR